MLFHRLMRKLFDITQSMPPVKRDIALHLMQPLRLIQGHINPAAHRFFACICDFSPLIAVRVRLPSPASTMAK